MQNGSGFRQRVRVGCAGWTIPKQSRAYFVEAGSHLSRYSLVFNCCEINSSFYGPHKPETWERWARSVPDDFRFSVKMPRSITHEAQLRCSSEILSNFVRQISFLEHKLGPILVQLPPRLEFGEACAHTFFSQLRDIYSGDIILEPRHASWFQPVTDAMLREFRVARVAADPACVPEAIQPAGWTRLAYFRLHGSPRVYYSAYSSDFLHRLSKVLASLSVTSDVWCVFDNTALGYAIENALELSLLLAATR